MPDQDPSSAVSLQHKSRPSFAVVASWTALSLALGCVGAVLLLQLVNEISPFGRTRQGVLTGFLPRAVLCLAWAGEALAVIVGCGSLFLVRRADATSKSLQGIGARSLCAVAVGLCGSVVLWLIVGHVVIGF
jgi:hypothetical protein